MRVLADGAIDAAKPIKEGLSEQHVADLLAATQAQEVRAARPSSLRIGMQSDGAAHASRFESGHDAQLPQWRVAVSSQPSPANKHFHTVLLMSAVLVSG